MARAKRPAKVSDEERLQVRARRLAGHGFALLHDELGRDRLVTGTAESRRLYDIPTGGKTVNVRIVDPLKGIASLSDAHRDAAKKYRETFEFCAGEGARSVQLQVRVQGGKMGAGIPEALSIAHGSLAAARAAIGHHEIIGTVDAVCVLGMSLREVSARTRDPREALLHLLRIGLDNLACHYGFVPRPKQKS